MDQDKLVSLYVKNNNKLRQLRENSNEYDNLADELDKIWSVLDQNSINKIKSSLK
jgi:hypothetical protein